MSGAQNADYGMYRGRIPRRNRRVTAKPAVRPTMASAALRRFSLLRTQRQADNREGKMKMTSTEGSRLLTLKFLKSEENIIAGGNTLDIDDIDSICLLACTLALRTFF